MKKERKMKFSKFKIAKINHLQLKGGVNSNACETNVNCLTIETCSPDPTDSCTPTVQTRTDDSLA